MNRLSSRKARIDTEGNRKRYCDIKSEYWGTELTERIDNHGAVQAVLALQGM